MAATVVMVGVKDLCDEFSIEAKDLRTLLRKQGFKAPEIPREKGQFGPKAKYEWAEGSADLKKIRAAIQEALDAPDKPKEVAPVPAASAAKGKSKK